MVLPEGIEPSTSPLPMECSTTELRQHAPIRESAKKAPPRRADPCHKAPTGASAGRQRCHQKGHTIHLGHALPGMPVSDFRPSAWSLTDMTLLYDALGECIRTGRR